MQWKTIYKYVDLLTGEITETKKLWKEEINREIIIIKKESHGHYTKTERVTTITKYYKRNPYKQQSIQF